MITYDSAILGAESLKLNSFCDGRLVARPLAVWVTILMIPSKSEKTKVNEAMTPHIKRSLGYQTQPPKKDILLCSSVTTVIYSVIAGYQSTYM